MLRFQNERLFVFYDQQTTQNHRKYFGSMNEAFWTRRLCEWQRREKQVTNRLPIVVFSQKTSDKSNWKLEKSSCKLVFTKMVFDS